MFATNRYLTAADVAFSALDIIEGFDAVALGEKVINATATVCAIIVAVVSYIVTALQLFWLDNGKVITTRAFQFIITLADFAGGCYHAGRKLRPVVTHNLNRLADTAFFTLAA